MPKLPKLQWCLRHCGVPRGSILGKERGEGAAQGTVLSPSVSQGGMFCPKVFITLADFAWMIPIQSYLGAKWQGTLFDPIQFCSIDHVRRQIERLA